MEDKVIVLRIEDCTRGKFAISVAYARSEFGRLAHILQRAREQLFAEPHPGLHFGMNASARAVNNHDNSGN